MEESGLVQLSGVTSCEAGSSTDQHTARSSAGPDRFNWSEELPLSKGAEVSFILATFLRRGVYVITRMDSDRGVSEDASVPVRMAQRLLFQRNDLERIGSTGFQLHLTLENYNHLTITACKITIHPTPGEPEPQAGVTAQLRPLVEAASGTQRTTTVTFAIPSTPSSSLPPHVSSPISSPPSTGHASSLPGSTSSPTLTDVFGLPTPPLGSLGSGSSRSPSPLTLLQAASNKPFANKPVPLWTKHDVADWLESLNLGEHRDAFMDNEIEGSHLPNLQKEDLIDLGVTRVGHRMNIERALKLLLDR
ncbi:hypothetical protein NFI96_003061 [Prochilodus magdalenae]|nr:hypothetical protein NFI96_003061 [Prochilodus magdalenae]